MNDKKKKPNPFAKGGVACKDEKGCKGSKGSPGEATKKPPFLKKK